MAGESAQREFERRRARRRAQSRSRKGRVLGLVIIALFFAVGAVVPVLPSLMLGLGDVHFGAPSLVLGSVMAAGGAVRLFAPPQSETAWLRGAEGERIVGRALDGLAAEGARSLHDRRMPGSRANIDHITVTPLGVFTVDAKRYTGKLETRRRGRELWINGRNRSKLIDQARRQAAAVTALLRDAGHVDVEVHPALCFVDTTIPWLFAPSSVEGVLVTTPRRLKNLLVGKGPVRLSPHRVAAIAGLLESSLRSAAAPPTRPSTGRAAADDRSTGSDAAPPGKHSSTAPTCRCGQPMVRRVRRADQTPFYGCSTFPRCRHTRPV